MKKIFFLLFFIGISLFFGYQNGQYKITTNKAFAAIIVPCDPSKNTCNAGDTGSCTCGGSLQCSHVNTPGGACYLWTGSCNACPPTPTTAPTCNSSNCQIFCDTSCNEYRASCVTSSSCQSTGSLIASNTSACNGVGGLSCPKTSSLCTPGTGTTKAACGNQPSQYKCTGVNTCTERTYACRPQPIDSTSTCTLDSHGSAAQILCCPSGGTCSNGICSTVTTPPSGNAWSCSGSSCVNVGAGNGSFPNSSCNGTCTAPPVSCQQCINSSCQTYSISNCQTSCGGGCSTPPGTCP